MNAGKWLILGILTVAVAAGVAAWMHRYSRSDAVQAFWGKQTLDLIANSPEVDASGWTNGQTAERRRLTVAKGMLNVRYMLGSDFAYQWPAEERSVQFDTAWGLEFRRGTECSSIHFNAECTLASEPATNKTIALVPAAATNLKSFFDERFAEGAASSNNGSPDAQ